MKENSLLSQDELQLLNETYDEALKEKLLDNIYKMLNGVDLYLVHKLTSRISSRCNSYLSERKLPIIEFGDNFPKF
jgi:hypothetical protein